MIEWRPILDTGYSASSEGDIRRDAGGRGAQVGCNLAQHPGGGRMGNYLRVSLSIDGIRKTWNVHVLVAIAWHGDRRSEGMTVDHRNENSEDNPPSNLRWLPGPLNSSLGSKKRWAPGDDAAPWDV